MRAWKVIVLIDLALCLGLGAGYLAWGLRAARLEGELAAAQARTASGAARRWEVEGVVRAVRPDIGLVVITHGEIPGYMPPMTMGFRAASPAVTRTVRVGDAVRFTLEGLPPNVVVTAIEKTK